MDNIKTLFDKKQFDLIIDLTKDSTSYEERWIRLTSLMCLEKYKEALEEISTHRELFLKGNPYKTISTHLNMILGMNDIDLAKKEYEYYSNLPYISQKVEEFLREYPDLIEKSKNKEGLTFYTIDEIEDVLLTSQNEPEIAKIVFALKDYNIVNIADILVEFINRNDVNSRLKTFALLLLVNGKYDHEISYKTNGKNIKLVPAKLLPPFVGKDYEYSLNKLNELGNKNSSVISTSIEILNNYIMDKYPFDIYSVYDKDLVLIAINSIALDYLSLENIPLTNEVSNIKEIIKKVLESSPILKI